MATAYFSDQESSVAANSLSTPTETPFMTPQPSLSRRSSRHGAASSFGDASAASPGPPGSGSTSEDPVTDDSISLLDPRRFTPSLQANLVAEILNLRREIDSKHRDIEDLETTLHSTKHENELLSGRLSTSQRENRSAKHQIQQLEVETLSALEELATERDRIKQDNEQLRSKLEASQKKTRNQVDESDRTQELWQKDKEAWESEKRSLERRIHVTETRLKNVLEELAAQHAAVQDHVESEVEDSGFGGNASDTGSVQSSPRRNSSRLDRHQRNQSSGSVRSFGRGYRASILTIGSEAHGKLAGLSLADELEFDEEDEELDELELDSDDYPENEMRARRAMVSRASTLPDEKARKMLGLVIEEKEKPTTHQPEEKEPSRSLDTTLRDQSIDTIMEPKRQEYVEPVIKPEKPEYVDTGVQPSPPSSPRVAPEEMAAARNSGYILAAMDIEANQRKKRVSAPASELHRELASNKKSGLMVSTSCQTLGQPLSPPATPTIFLPQSPQSPVADLGTASIATQTETRIECAPRIEDPPSPTRAPPPPPPPPEPMPEIRIEGPPSPTRIPPPPPISIPQIAIHPPGSTPGSPKHAVLPPGTRSAASQTGPDLAITMRSTAVQTEPIRIDQRPVKLPPHLLPSAISSNPGTPMKEGPVLAKPFEEKGKAPLRPSTQELLESIWPASIKPTEDRYPGNNDNGPLTRDSAAGIRRPFRTSSLFAGFDGASSDEDAADEEASSDEERYGDHATIAQVRAVKYSRPFANPPTPVPEEKEPPSRPPSSRSSHERPEEVEKPAISGSLRKQPSMRRSALVQSGVTVHEQRSRSPSLGDVGSSKSTAKPPFPVPTRLSSRRPPPSKSEGSQSPAARSSNMFTNRRARQQHARQDSLRKVRSVAALPRGGHQRSKSPPLPMSSLTSPEDAYDVPPLPRDRVTTPQNAYASRHHGHGRQPSGSTAVTNSNASVGSSVQSISVVDAIASTMVGEWMYKYVRGRKSFGVADAVTPEFGKDDGSGNAGGGGMRHKRWVWISPYERAIMWSSKQPTSGMALLGKTGRKLSVQSVLDVKDDSPTPKGVGLQPVFNRSILILTPARALKFTAYTAERHYIWLTALSFLAHSSQAIPDLNSLPAVPAHESDQTKRNTAALGRRPINNSVRLAKAHQNSAAKNYTNRAEPIYENTKLNPTPQSPVSEAASPPVVPRFHGRKRSLTSPRQATMPPAIPGKSFMRGFSHTPPVPRSSYSTAASSVGMSEPAKIPLSASSSIWNGGGSRRTSEASSNAATANGARSDFFDAGGGLGTVRMEAFVEPCLSPESSRYPGGGYPGLGPSVRERQQRKNSQWSSSQKSSLAGSRTPSAAGGEIGDMGSDVFRGF